MFFIEYYNSLRFFKKTLIITIIIFIILGGIIFYFLYGVKVYYFFTIDRLNVLKSDDFKYNNYYATQYSDQFTETIKGWFSNPAMIEEILGYVDMRYFSVRKIEKQNIQITFTEQDIKKANYIANNLKQVLNNYLKKHNETSGSDFVYTNESLYIKQTNIYLYAITILISSIVLGFIASLFIISIIAYHRKLYILDDNLKIENTEIIGRINNNDFSFLIGDWKTIVIGICDQSVNKSKDYNISFIKYVLSICKELTKYGKKVLLVDLDLTSRDLHKYFNNDFDNAKYKGITDIQKNDDVLKHIAMVDNNKLFYFLSAGGNNLFDISIFNNTDFDKIIFYTRYPQNNILIKSINFDRILVYMKKGVSSIFDLEILAKKSKIEIICD